MGNSTHCSKAAFCRAVGAASARSKHRCGKGQGLVHHASLYTMLASGSKLMVRACQILCQLQMNVLPERFGGLWEGVLQSVDDTGLRAEVLRGAMLGVALGEGTD